VTGPGKTAASFRVLSKENRYADPVLAFGHPDPHHHPACAAFALTKGIHFLQNQELIMGFGRGALLWLLGIPLPIILLLALFWR
jgi:hypothetical protein